MSAELKSFGTLFSETWVQFKERALVILGVLLLTSLVVIVGAVVFGIVAALSFGGKEVALQQVQQGQLSMPVMLLFTLFFLVIMVLALWSQSATIAVAVDKSLGVWEALRAGWQRLWSVGWIFMLAGGIIITGFLLFIVPGIFFSVSLMFALYPLFDENIRGMDAIQTSHHYVKGRWWNTLGKLLLIWLIAIVLDLIPLVGQFLYFLFMPFLLLFLVAMYRDLKETAPEVTANSQRSIMWLFAVIGIIVPLAGTLAAVVSLGPRLPEILEQVRQETRIQVEPDMPRDTPQTSSGEQGFEPAEPPVSPGVKEGIWRDPVGDVAEFGVGRWLDIETVTVRVDTGTLQIDIQTDTPLAAAFNSASTTAQSLYRFATLYFDTDVNRETGGIAGDKEGRAGYDIGLDLTIEAPRNEPEKGQVHVSLFRFENGMRSFLGALPENEVQVSGNRIRLRLPYEILGVRAGNQLRISFVEAAQEQGSGLSKDKLIDL